MNWTTVLSALIPALLQLLNDPNFQAVVKAVELALNQKIASGMPAPTAAQQATGQIAAAAALHLTGNPVTDFQAFVGSLKPPNLSPPHAPQTGTFTS